MKSWIMGLLFVCLAVAGWIFLSSGFAGSNTALDGQGSEIPKTNIQSSNIIPNTVDPITSATISNEITAQSDEKVSAYAKTCTIDNSGDFVVDLSLKNPGRETRVITFDPSGTKMDILPNRTYRYDLHLAMEVSIINISVDDGTELSVKSPNCTTGGWSGSDGFSMQEQNPPGPKQSTPPPPVPELSPLVLTLAGISGLLLLSRTRKN